MIAEFLREVGFDSHTANTGLDALRIYDALRPALIITDESPSEAQDGRGVDYDHHSQEEAAQRTVCGR